MRAELAITKTTIYVPHAIQTVLIANQQIPALLVQKDFCSEMHVLQYVLMDNMAIVIARHVNPAILPANYALASKIVNVPHATMATF
jgi:hypothetical protein